MAVRRTHATDHLYRMRMLVGYIDRLMGRPIGFGPGKLDCYKFARDWAGGGPEPDYQNRREAYRMMVRWGGRRWHRGADFRLPILGEGETPLPGDLCTRRVGRIPALGIYEAGGRGYFLRESPIDPGMQRSPAEILECDSYPIWRVDRPNIQKIREAG